MAWLEKRGCTFRIKFRFGGRHLSKSVKTSNQREAQGCLARLEENLRLVERGRLEVPPGADLATFLISDGKLNGRPQAVATLTLRELFQQYETRLPNGTMEDNSLETVKLHMKHLERHLGARTAAQRLTLSALQAYVACRADERGHYGGPISPVTIKKELTSLSGIWTWGVQMGLLTGSFPNRGLKYPKTAEKPPFQTWAEIDRQIARGGLSEAECAELWDCLYLTLPEIDQLLQFVQQNARYSFLYPMVVFAAHTGARRSEMMRSRINDIDFASNTVLIREKKRVKSKRTTRRVPMSPKLGGVMQDWLASHPGGLHTFCHTALHIPQSNKTRTELTGLTKNEANHHLQRMLVSSKWEKVRGWHVFRHSFASNCASFGVDQRLIDEWLGHQTEEMRKRYRHLLPDQQQKSIQVVFGGSPATPPAATLHPESVPAQHGRSSTLAKGPGRNSASWHGPA